MSGLAKRRDKASDQDAIRKKFEQGIRLQAQSRHDEAVSRFRKVVFAEPDNMAALNAACQSLTKLARPGEAFRLIEEIAAQTPHDAPNLLGLANICFSYRHFSCAERLYRHVLDVNPGSFAALGNLASMLVDRREYQEAVDLLSRAIEIRPDSAEIYNTLGRALAGAAMYDEAEASYRRALSIDAKLGAVYANYAALLDIVGRHKEALELLRITLSTNPDCDSTRWNLARTLLATGHIEAGWDMYGFGFACGARTPFRPFPGLLWQGEDLAEKTIMVWKEQGIGDDLYFSTCYHDLIEEAGHVIIETDPRLVPLYKRTWPKATVRAETGTATGLGNCDTVDFDVTAPAGIVASHRRRSLASFPQNPPVLIADPERRQSARKWLATLGPGPRIGFCWRSSIRNHVRNSFATGLEDWICFLRRNDVQAISLQYGDAGEEIIEAGKKFGIRLHCMPGLDTMNDLEGTAALTAELDFFVAQWNASSEMAGALGIPGAVYLPAGNPVMLGTDRIPWHPCLRPFPVKPGFDPAMLAKAMTDDAVDRLRTAGKI